MSLLQSILHSTATMIYLKTASQDHFCFSGLHTDPTLPTKYHLNLQRGHRRHLSWSPPPSPGECPPTTPHHTRGSNNLPAVPPTSRLLPTDTHAPLSTLKLAGTWRAPCRPGAHWTSAKVRTRPGSGCSEGCWARAASSFRSVLLCFGLAPGSARKPRRCRGFGRAAVCWPS